jgi:hypothetical protein
MYKRGVNTYDSTAYFCKQHIRERGVRKDVRNLLSTGLLTKALFVFAYYGIR